MARGDHALRYSDVPATVLVELLGEPKDKVQNFLERRSVGGVGRRAPVPAGVDYFWECGCSGTAGFAGLLAYDVCSEDEHKAASFFAARD